jgi:hypothetical protein
MGSRASAPVVRCKCGGEEEEACSKQTDLPRITRSPISSHPFAGHYWTSTPAAASLPEAPMMSSSSPLVLALPHVHKTEESRACIFVAEPACVFLPGMMVQYRKPRVYHCSDDAHEYMMRLELETCVRCVLTPIRLIRMCTTTVLLTDPHNHYSCRSI